MSVLHKAKLRPACEKFLDFVDFDMMLSGQLLDNLFEPDEAGDSQFQVLQPARPAAPLPCQAEQRRTADFVARYF